MKRTPSRYLNDLQRIEWKQTVISKAAFRGRLNALKNLCRDTVSLPECLHQILPHNVCFVCVEILPTEHSGVEK